MSDVTTTPPVPLDTADDVPASRTAGGPRSWWWRELRPLLLRLHFYAGILVGPFLLVAALTGLLYTITPQLEQIVHRHELTAPVPPGASALPLATQVSAAVAALPEGTVTEIRPPRATGGTTRVVFDAPGTPPDYSRTVFVDPYTAQVRGTLTTFGEWLPVRAWFDEMHRTLHLGDVGRLYSELAASWLWVLTLSGLALWLARRRRTRRVRRTLLPEGGEPGRGRLLSWHATVGVWATLGLLFLSATGLTWSHFAGDNVTTLRSALSWSTPDVPTTLPTPVAAGAAATPAPALPDAAQRALAVARAHGMTDPVALTPPDGPGVAWQVQQVQRSWPEKQDAMAVGLGATPDGDALAHQVRFADWPLAAKLARWGVDAHMGLLFGPVSQVALAALALGLLCMVVWGYRMWWLRRPPSGGRGGPVAGAPGGARRPGFGAVLTVAAAAVAVGVFLPVFGASVLLFLLVDAVRHGRGAPERAELSSV
ncbi:MAG TPA: PepSY-associated TM helix domain-containing protein [Pseudonocardia sp.]|jgi:uncharacterized iron-regulated membrane protein